MYVHMMHNIMYIYVRTCMRTLMHTHVHMLLIVHVMFVFYYVYIVSLSGTNSTDFI